MGTLARFFGLEGKRALQNVSTQLASLDPEAYGIADLQTLEADLDKTGQVLARLRRDAQRESAEADEAHKVFDINVAAAERLHVQINEPGATEERKASLSTSLATLLDRVTQDKTKWDQEQQEADEANALLHETKQLYEQKAAMLRERKGKLQSATRELERSKIRKESAERRAETAAEVAGLRDGLAGNQLTSALSALERAAAKNNDAAAAAAMKATALRQPTTGGEDDPNIVAALAAVKTPAITGASLDDRLAALTGKTYGAPQQALPAPENHVET